MTISVINKKTSYHEEFEDSFRNYYCCSADTQFDRMRKRPIFKIVGTWYYSEDPEDLTIFNADGTGQNTYLGSSDSFVYSYNSKTGVLEFIWDDGIYESYTVWIDGNTLYVTDGETVEIYLRK